MSDIQFPSAEVNKRLGEYPSCCHSSEESNRENPDSHNVDNITRHQDHQSV